ncbi:MAG: PIG-L deacetylase family protein [Myxococcota bacterium]
MGRQIPHPADLFADGRRHLVVLAHHDDELPYAGLIARMRPHVRVVWLTNSDGIAHESDMTPDAYAKARYQESLDALSHLGLEEAQVNSLWHSEYALYELFAQMVRGEHPEEVPERFLTMADEIEAEARAFKPDVVWTLAYQGGHPEHDLTHLYATRFVNRWRAETGQELPYFELPAYELIVVPLRFRPWRSAPYHAIQLTEDEWKAKDAMMDCYPTQARIIEEFRTIIGLYARLSWLRFKPFTFDDYGRREVFAPVPEGRDYERSSHMSSRLDYPFDDYQGTPMRFSEMLAPIARALGLTSG